MANTGVIVAGGALALLGIYLLTKKGKAEAEAEPGCWKAKPGKIYYANFLGAEPVSLGESVSPGVDPDTVGFAYVEIWLVGLEQYADPGGWDYIIRPGDPIRFAVLNDVEICLYEKALVR